MDSILTSIKKLLGIDESYTHFDPDLVMHINSALFIIWQIGAAKDGQTAYSITDDTATWDEFFAQTGIDAGNLEFLKTYICKKVRLNWDTPTSSALVESLKSSIMEDEWRLSVLCPIPEDLLDGNDGDGKDDGDKGGASDT